MKWPRGRWNGQRIVGVEVKVRIDVLHWGLSWGSRFGSALRVGPVFVWAQWSFEF